MIAKLVTCLGAAAAAAAPAAAQPVPTWTAAPTLAQVVAAYPPRARSARVGGRAELSCRANHEGWLRDCGVLVEQPGGYGFGTAARRLAEGLRTSGRANAEDIRVSVAFDPAMLGPGPFVLQTPTWAALPSAGDFQGTFPKAANGVNSVRVVMTCDVAAGGALVGCAVDEEDPPGQGYGAGVLALAQKIRVGLWTPDGLPEVGARVSIPIRFQLSQAPPPQ